MLEKYFTAEMAKKLIAGTLVTGGVAFGVTVWSGKADLDIVQEKFDWVKQQYSNSLQTIENYKTVLGQKVKDIKGYESIQDQLNAQIVTLKEQIKQLEQNGTEEDQAEITRLQNRVKELEGELEKAQISEEDGNKIVGEISRLNEQINTANRDAKALKNHVETESNIAGHDVISVAAIEAGNSTRNPMLTYELNGGDWSSVPSAKQNTITTFLTSLNILDTFHESPILLHLNSFNGDNYISVYTNSKEAFDRLSAVDGFVSEQGFYTIDGQIVTQDEFLSSSSNGKLQISINYASDEAWTGSLGHATPDHK